jgi:hypothetical protein
MQCLLNLRRSIVFAALPLTFCAIMVSAASAEIIQIPAITFSMRSSSIETGDANFGTLTAAKGKYYAAVPFTESGLRVCAFSLVHRDNDADSQVIARLFKKPIVTTACIVTIEESYFKRSSRCYEPQQLCLCAPVRSAGPARIAGNSC